MLEKDILTVKTLVHRPKVARVHARDMAEVVLRSSSSRQS